MDLADPQTFAAVYNQHFRGVYNAALRIVQNTAQAQDVAQDVFVRVWRNPSKFDARRGEIGSYLRLMGRSRALDLWREGQAAGRATDRLKAVVGTAPAVESHHPETVMLRASERDELREAVRALPEAQREAVFLSYWGGMTADEVASTVGVPLGTAKSRIRLGLGKLRDHIDVGAPAMAA